MFAVWITHAVVAALMGWNWRDPEGLAILSHSQVPSTSSQCFFIIILKEFFHTIYCEHILSPPQTPPRFPSPPLFLCPGKTLTIKCKNHALTQTNTFTLSHMPRDAYLARFNNGHILCSHLPLHTSGHGDSPAAPAQHQHLIVVLGRAAGSCVQLEGCSLLSAQPEETGKEPGTWTGYNSN